MSTLNWPCLMIIKRETEVPETESGSGDRNYDRGDMYRKKHDRSLGVTPTHL